VDSLSETPGLEPAAIAELVRSHLAQPLYRTEIRAALTAEVLHPNGRPKFTPEGMMVDEHGNRSIFDDVDQ
jgi:hypothetical protein